jgi:hypothetical protein
MSRPSLSAIFCTPTWTRTTPTTRLNASPPHSIDIFKSYCAHSPTFFFSRRFRSIHIVIISWRLLEAHALLYPCSVFFHAHIAQKEGQQGQRFNTCTSLQSHYRPEVMFHWHACTCRYITFLYNSLTLHSAGVENGKGTQIPRARFARFEHHSLRSEPEGSLRDQS